MSKLYSHIASVLEFQGLSDQAEQFYAQAINNDEKDLSVYKAAVNLCIILFNKTQNVVFLDKALKYVRQGRELYDDEELENAARYIAALLGINIERRPSNLFMPNPILEYFFSELKDVEIDAKRLEELKNKYGNLKDDELKALLLKELYHSVVEKDLLHVPEWKRWCALLYFYIHGLTPQTYKTLKTLLNKKQFIKQFPPLTQHLANRLCAHMHAGEVKKVIKLAVIKINRVIEALRSLTLADRDPSAALLALNILERTGIVKNNVIKDRFLKQTLGTDKLERVNKQALLKALELEKQHLLHALKKKIAFFHANNQGNVLKHVSKLLKLTPAEREAFLMNN
jgi:tetratricopeptide (TPR) repeat protein